MKQICKFESKPSTLNDGGYKNGHWIAWLNLNVSEIECEEGSKERFQSITERLVLKDKSIYSFLEVVDKSLIAEATKDEVAAIMGYFYASDDIDAWKAILTAQIKGYDSSSHVNRVYLNGYQTWIDKSTRVGLVNSVTIEKNENRKTTCLWYGGYNIIMDVDKALDCLSKLELYALDCFNVTAKHLADIKKIDSVEELMSYDIRADYSEALRFDIPL